MLVKDKDSAQFYEVRKIGLDPSQSKQYDKIELKPPADEGGASFPLDTLFSRALDTVEDAVLHARRIPYDLGWFLADSQKKEQRKTIVVLGTCSHVMQLSFVLPVLTSGCFRALLQYQGSGWAAHAILKVADTYKLPLIVVSPTNHFVFTPSK